MPIVLAILLAGHLLAFGSAWAQGTGLQVGEATSPSPAAPEPVQTDKQVSRLTLSPVALLVRGQEVRIDLGLRTAAGAPIEDAVVWLYDDGDYLRRKRTDGSGNIAISLGNDWPVGEHQLRAVFEGDGLRLGAEATTTVAVRPAVLTVETVPPLEGIGFSFDGVPFYTDEAGVARLEMPSVGTYPLEVLPVTTGANTRIRFARWEDSVFVPERTVSSRKDKHFRVGFYISHRVRQRFVNTQNERVRGDRIASFTLKARDGSRYTYTDGQPRWFRRNNVSLLANGLEATPLFYAAESVMIDGANVVNRNQQTFLVTEDQGVWTLKLILYDIRVRALDALLGTPIGDGIRLEYPDGRAKTLPFDEHGEVSLQRLARGLYKLQVTGASGVAPVTPVVLSRDQEVELKVLSRLDIGGSVFAGASLALGLLLYGRRRWIIDKLRSLRTRRVESNPLKTR